ncbi:M4 family metallopeptidase [Flexivirga sp.]|uniref:M4 family metallopeptidase n=1 Tax=Flexivirga sp. TaxID=1962927 RepID=UPI002D7FA031|nr:M4 family metallopeptidase [Flexivirga sp.]
MRVNKTAMLFGIAAVSTSCVIGTTSAHAATAPSASHRASGVSNEQVVDSFLSSHPTSIASSSSDEYELIGTTTSADGTSHFRYQRTYKGLPVVGGDFVIHAKGGKVVGQSGNQRKAISVSTTPTVAADASRSHAVGSAHVYNAKGATSPKLVVDAAGSKPVLAWMTVVTGVQADGITPSHKAVLVDAQTGRTIRSSEMVNSLMSAQASKKAMARNGVHKPATLTTKAPANLKPVSWGSLGKGHGHNAGVAADGTGKSLFLGDVNLTTTQGSSGYEMTDPNHGGNSACDMNNAEVGNCALFTDDDNAWGDGTNSDRATAAVDVYYGAAETWDYYKDAYNRNGIFDDGKGVPSRVHYGSGYVNAFWDGSQMTYGDGDGDNAPLVAIDVAGHEMSHGVAEALANLGYDGDVGGINESNSDVNGTMVEFKANSSVDKPDFLIGETIDINGDGTPLRYMDQPSKDGSSLDCWSSATQNEDPHYTSGVGNHAFFLLANGSGESEWGNSPTCDDSTVTGIGKDKAATIWYDAIKDYGTSNMSYADLRAGMIKSADALYGADSTESKAVAAAWSAVSVS